MYKFTNKIGALTAPFLFIYFLFIYIPLIESEPLNLAPSLIDIIPADTFPSMLAFSKTSTSPTTSRSPFILPMLLTDALLMFPTITESSSTAMKQF